MMDQEILRYRKTALPQRIDNIGYGEPAVGYIERTFQHFTTPDHAGRQHLQRRRKHNGISAARIPDARTFQDGRTERISFYGTDRHECICPPRSGRWRRIHLLCTPHWDHPRGNNRRNQPNRTAKTFLMLWGSKGCLGKLLDGKIQAAEITELDYQQNHIEQIFYRQKNRITKASNPLMEATARDV